MFRSTYCHLAFKEQECNLRSLWPTTMDLERGTRLVRLGRRGGLDDDLQEIFCLIDAERSIPFSAKVLAEIGWKPLSEFRSRARGTLPHPDAGFRIIDVRISDIGAHPDSVRKGIRSSVHFMDIWNGEGTPPLTVPSVYERKQVFRDIQEALPVWWFDNYVSVEHPDPAICRHVLAAAPEWSDVTDSSREVETASVVLKPAPLSMEPFEEVHAWLADVEGQTMKIEEILARTFDFERGTLFYDHRLTWGLSDNARFWQLLRDSHRAHYTDHYEGFERFLVRVRDILISRLASRRVLQTYPSWRRRLAKRGDDA